MCCQKQKVRHDLTIKCKYYQEQEQEVVDTIVGVIDKQTGSDGLNIEPAAKAIKDALDKQYGAQWHCILGKGFSYDVTAQTGSLMYSYRSLSFRS